MTLRSSSTTMLKKMCLFEKGGCSSLCFKKTNYLGFIYVFYIIVLLIVAL